MGEKAFAPEQRQITEEDIQRHLSGEKCVGYYICREDSTVTGCTVDLDHHGSNDQALVQAQQLCRAYEECGVVPLMEVSQSGEGAHVWTFFHKPIPAADARKFMRGVLAYAGISAKEIYPRQDELTPEKPLGNLMRYPLWNRSRFVQPDTLTTLDPEKTLLNLVPVSEDRFTQCMELWETYLTDHIIPNYDEYTTEGLPPRVHQLLEAGRSSLLFRRWHGDTTGLLDCSRSGILYGIAIQLIRAMVPTPEVEAALRYWCGIHQYEKGSDSRRLHLTVCRAYNAAASIHERRDINGHDLEALAHQCIDALAREDDILIPSGVAALDKAVGGLGLGEWGVLAARPGQLKSTLAMQWIDSATAHGHKSLVEQLEMTKKQFSKKSLIRAGVSLGAIKTPEGHTRAHEQVKAYFRAKEKALFDEGKRQLDDLERSIRFYVEEHGVRFIVIDHQGYIYWKRDSEYVDQTEAAKRVKSIAKELDVAILSLVHLRRPDKGGNKDPALEQLRASGEIEQSADVVVGARWPFGEGVNAPKQDYILFPLKCRDRDFDSRPCKVKAITEEQRFE